LMLKYLRKLSVFSTSSLGSRLMSLNNQAIFQSPKIADEIGFVYPIGWRKGITRIINWYQSQGVL
jgi:hypothetical protein